MYGTEYGTEYVYGTECESAWRCLLPIITLGHPVSSSLVTYKNMSEMFSIPYAQELKAPWENITLLERATLVVCIACDEHIAIVTAEFYRSISPAVCKIRFEV